MDKPTVFFSHSSKDRELLRRIKERLVEKTGNSISIFVSSDGQSIPLGRNWVHKVQESLEKAHVMFVFVSPASISSQWIQFEAGYAYSKNIKVIPVGINGIDLGKLSPPLSLLQGFNIISNDGLNNIVAVLNAEFGLAFKEDFDQQQYINIFSESDQETEAQDLASKWIQEFTIEIKDDSLKTDREEAIKSIKSLLERESVPFQEGKYQTRVHGWSFRAVVPGGGIPGVEIKFVPELAGNALKHIDGALGLILTNDTEINVVAALYDHISGDVNNNRISAKLFKYGVELGPDENFIYKGMKFRISGGYNSHSFYIRLSKASDNVSSFSIEDLIAVLFDSGVLWEVESPIMVADYG
jgi:TIR domain